MRTGGVDGAVARLAERAYQRLTAPQRERARVILMRLTDAEQPAPVKRRVPLPELETDRDDDAASALAVLTESRLVTVDEGTVEVAHEALLREWPRLRAWLEEDVEGRRLHQHLTHAAGEWERSARDPAELYRGARLASALDWAASHDPELNELEREFLEESRTASEREAERQRRANRRLRTLLAGVGVLLAAAVVAGVIALSQRQEARSAATTATGRELAAAALANLEVDPERSVLLALEAVERTRSVDASVLPEAEEALHRAVIASRIVMSVPGGGRPAWSPDGTTFVTEAPEGTGVVNIRDAETGEPVRSFHAHDAEVVEIVSVATARCSRPPEATGP